MDPILDLATQINTASKERRLFLLPVLWVPGILQTTRYSDGRGRCVFPQADGGAGPG